MKKPWEWDESDLLQLVNTGAQESVDLEFKASGALQNTDRNKDEISKDVSAFANSAGGTIIYGMTEDRTTHIAASLDMGCDPNVTTKEWLEQVINSKIQRRIEGVRISRVSLTSTSPGKVAYVVYVPASNRAPHQAADKRFYRRYNFQVLAMEEYEIRDVALRGEVPDLRMEFILSEPSLIFNSEDTFSVPFPLITSITNDTLEPANYAVIAIYIDTRLAIQDAKGLEVNRNLQLNIGDKEIPVTVLRLNWGIQAKMPIFHATFSIPDTPILLRAPNNEQLGQTKYYFLGYEIKSPRMPIKSSYGILGIRSGRIWLSDTHLTADQIIENYEKLAN